MEFNKVYENSYTGGPLPTQQKPQKERQGKTKRRNEEELTDKAQRWEKISRNAPRQSRCSPTIRARITLLCSNYNVICVRKNEFPRKRESKR